MLDGTNRQNIMRTKRKSEQSSYCHHIGIKHCGRTFRIGRWSELFSWCSGRGRCGVVCQSVHEIRFFTIFKLCLDIKDMATRSYGACIFCMRVATMKITFRVGSVRICHWTQHSELVKVKDTVFVFIRM